MKAAVIEKQGGIENIVYRDYPDPECGPRDVVIRVKACGLNYFDIFVRRGMPGLPVPMPWISGADIAGEIAEIGSEVEGWSIGDRCLVDPLTDEGMTGETRIGGMSELTRFPAEFVMPLDERLSFERAAAIPANYGTTNRMLFTNGDIQKGDLVLVLGASGGVGTASVSAAKAHGCTVIACAGTDEKCERLKEMGADYTINYSTHDFSKEAWTISGKKGVDVCVNFTCGDTWHSSIRALAHHGKLLTCGATAGFDVATDVRFIWEREIKIIGSNGYSFEEVRRGMMEVADGTIVLPELLTFPLSELGQAEALMEARDFFGKIVMIP